MAGKGGAYRPVDPKAWDKGYTRIDFSAARAKYPDRTRRDDNLLEFRKLDTPGMGWADIEEFNQFMQKALNASPPTDLYVECSKCSDRIWTKDNPSLDGHPICRPCYFQATGQTPPEEDPELTHAAVAFREKAADNRRIHNERLAANNPWKATAKALRPVIGWAVKKTNRLERLARKEREMSLRDQGRPAT